jgi:hypothetical protein
MGIVDIPDLTAEQLYHKAREWFSKTYVSSKSVIDYTDVDNFKIFGNSMIDVTMKGNFGMLMDAGYVTYTISVFFKDKKYKYVISDFVNVRSPGMNENWGVGGNLENETPICGKWKNTQKNWISLHEQTDIKIRTLIASLEKYIKSNTPSNGW